MGLRRLNGPGPLSSATSKHALDGTHRPREVIAEARMPELVHPPACRSTPRRCASARNPITDHGNRPVSGSHKRAISHGPNGDAQAG